MLRATSLTLDFGSLRAISCIDFEIVAGDAVALLGPNGAGKSTLFSLLAGLAQPSAGTLQRAPELSIGYAPQEQGIYPVLTAAENLKFFARLKGLKPTHSSIRESIECMAISHLLNRQAGRMSMGEQRRVHAAIALLGYPELLLLDEPTAGVDVHTRNQIVRGLDTFRRTGALVYSTHNLAEVENVANRVMILNSGHLAFDGSLQELLDEVPDRGISVRVRRPKVYEQGGIRENSLEQSVYLPSEDALIAFLQKLIQEDGTIVSIELVPKSVERAFDHVLSAK